MTDQATASDTTTTASDPMAEPIGKVVLLVFSQLQQILSVHLDRLQRKSERSEAESHFDKIHALLGAAQDFERLGFEEEKTLAAGIAGKLLRKLRVPDDDQANAEPCDCLYCSQCHHA